MLILTQRIGDTTVATLPDGSTIKATVLAIKGNQIRVGWEAAKSVSILRDTAKTRAPKEGAGA